MIAIWTIPLTSLLVDLLFPGGRTATEEYLEIENRPVNLIHASLQPEIQASYLRPVRYQPPILCSHLSSPAMCSRLCHNQLESNFGLDFH
jgi:hypothetical protein